MSYHQLDAEDLSDRERNLVISASVLVGRLRSGIDNAHDVIAVAKPCLEVV